MKKATLTALACTLCCASSSGADSLVVTTQPSSITSLTDFQMAVSVEDAPGHVDTSFNGAVTLGLGGGSPAGASLLSEQPLGIFNPGPLTVTAVNGVATFSNLLLDRGGAYTLQATSGALTPATPSINVTPAMQFSFEAQDTTVSHNPLASSTVQAGHDFDLAVFVRDIRMPVQQFPGIFAAWLNVSYNSALASITPTAHLSGPDPGISFGPGFTLVRSGELGTPGLINDVGASLAANPSTSARQLLFRVAVHADQAGTETFASLFDPAPPNAGHDSLIFHPTESLTADQIQFGQLTVTIVPEPSSFVLGGTCSLLLLGWGVKRLRNIRYHGRHARAFDFVARWSCAVHR